MAILRRNKECFHRYDIVTCNAIIGPLGHDVSREPAPESRRHG
jgi:hypothetical protein